MRDRGQAQREAAAEKKRQWDTLKRKAAAKKARQAVPKSYRKQTVNGSDAYPIAFQLVIVQTGL